MVWLRSGGVMETEGAGGASQREFDRASRWAAIGEWSDAAIIGWTLRGIVTSWNSGAERMYGYTADEIAGRNVSVLIPPGGSGEYAPVLDRLVRGEHVELYDSKARHKDGSIIDVSISLSPIRSPGGAVTGVSSVARDITARNRAAAERLVMQQQVQEAEHIQAAAQRAAALTRQLLISPKREVTQPEGLD